MGSDAEFGAESGVLGLFPRGRVHLLESLPLQKSRGWMDEVEEIQPCNCLCDMSNTLGPAKIFVIILI